ncbi:MAG: cytochrome c oxidase subunit 3 [Thermodesulfovibrionales bacterium]
MALEGISHHDQGVHEPELSIWPLFVGTATLVAMMGFTTAFQWKLPLVGMLVGGGGIAGVLIGLFGWVNEVHAQKEDAGLSLLAMVTFILSEAALFGALFSGYLYNLLQVSQWPPANTPDGVPPLGLALGLTVFLLSSSLTIHKAEGLLEKGDAKGFQRWLIITMLLGLFFLAGQVKEWWSLISEGFTVSTNAYSTFFFSITGLHGSHVLVGLILQFFILLLAMRGRVGHHKQSIVKACGYYWHFVDGVWLAVLSLIYILPAYR